MDEFAETWFLLSDHIQANMAAYIIGCVIVVPLVYFTRKWAVPLILYIAEICIYFSLMHVFVHVMVGLTAWFRTNSSVRALRADGLPQDAVFWSTPLVKFWERDLYDPQWVTYLEFVFMGIIVILVLKLRPLRTQKPKPRFSLDGAKKGGSDNASQAVAQKYGSKRYADDWTKEGAKSSYDSHLRRQ